MSYVLHNDFVFSLIILHGFHSEINMLVLAPTQGSSHIDGTVGVNLKIDSCTRMLMV